MFIVAMIRGRAVPILVFLCCAAANLAFWRFASDGVLCGGDIHNMVGAGASSYYLGLKDIASPEKLIARLVANSDPASVYVSGLLSQEAREAMSRMAGGTGSDADLPLILLDLNTRVIDTEVAWPESLSSGVPPLLGKSLAGRQRYNMLVMSRSFAENIQHCDRMPFLELIIRKINWKSFFILTSPTRYAPLSAIFTTLMPYYILDNSGNLWPVALVVACIYGFQMMFVYLLAVEALKSMRWAMLCVFLFLASVPSLLTTYSLFALPYFFIPTVMCAASFFYLRFRSLNHGGHFYLLLFFVFAFIGPWFREVALVIPFVVFAAELATWRGSRSLTVILLCLPLMVHGIYPSLFTWLIGINTGNFYSILQGGAMKAQMGGGINLSAACIVFVQLPPLLWLLVLSTIAMAAFRCQTLQSAGGGLIPAWLSKKLHDANGKMRWIQSISVVASASAVAYYFFGDYRNIGMPSQSGAGAVFILLAIFALCSLKHSAFFPCLFLGVLLPFMRINGNTEIHTIFILPALIVMIAFWLRDLCRMLLPVNRLLAAPVFALVMLGVGDQGMNLYACASSQRAAIQTNREMGEWIASNTARHGIVVGNFFNLVDVFYYSGFHFDPYESVENCPMGPGNVVHRNEDMRKVLENSAGSRPVYVVDADVERYEHQKAYHSNKYVAAPPGKLKEVARFKVFNRYWYIDPLKYFIPRWFISIPVYMDWSIDYYYNNETVLFSRVLKADYKIYRLEDISLKLLPDTPEPVAVAQSGKITVSSVLDKRNPGMSPAGLLSGSSIWHAQSPPKFPEWVEISYSDAFAIGSFSLLPQPNSHGGSECRRAPKDFVLQGSNDRTVWTDLLRVSDNTYHDGVEWRKWEISTASSWLYYRLQITSSGEPAFLTINQIRLDKAR